MCARRIVEHDRFGPVGPLRADAGPGKVGVVGSVSRYSDSLDPLVARGLIPSPNDGLGKFVVRSNGLLDLVGLTSSDWCAAGTRPGGSRPRKERALARAFLEAYNRHDTAGVLSLLTDDIVYADCDFPQGAAVSLSGKAAIAAWLRMRFAEGDRIVRPRIVLRSWLSQPPNDPTTAVIQAGRANEAFGGATRPLTVRIVPTADVTRVHMWQVWVDCTAQTSSWNTRWQTRVSGEWRSHSGVPLASNCGSRWCTLGSRARSM